MRGFWLRFWRLRVLDYWHRRFGLIDRRGQPGDTVRYDNEG